MSLYTPQSLPHTPSSHTMNAPLPPLPVELLSTWSSWRPSRADALLTPPHSNSPSRRVLSPQTHSNVVLPPIKHFHHDLARLTPDQSRPAAHESHHMRSLQATPPPVNNPHKWHNYDSSLRLPPVVVPHPPSHPVTATPDHATYCPERSLPSPPLVLDWVSSFQQQSSHFIAEKTCEMICYLWFSTQSQSTSSPSKRNRVGDDQQQQAYFPLSSSATASLQFSVSHAFIRFMQKVLETTQVSQSVIVLSLHYIYRMKARNPFTSGQSGSEYRVAVAALMMANKFVDDNTYTNKTWSEVSGIELDEINRMEREFLLGIDFGLYVDKTTYDSWLNLLKGLIMAKEKDSQHWRRSGWHSRSSRLGKGQKPLTSQYRRSRSTSHRARSSSPSHSVSYPPVMSDRSNLVFPVPQMALVPPHLYTGSKRSAADAFSPMSASFPPIKPSKRSAGLSLDIPEFEYPSPRSSEQSSASPMEPLQSFSKMSLGASPVDAGSTPAWASSIRQDVAPQTLVSAYRVDEKRPYAAPQNLFFYALSCSPVESENARKGRLHYHQPPPTGSVTQQMQPSFPVAIQSASASPYDIHMRVPLPAPLPPFSEVSRDWTRASHSPAGRQVHRPQQQFGDTHVPSAPFANAGPPGFQFYATAPHPDAAHVLHRGRRL
ncbi:cyclin-domain-containing protein [Amylocystis lapponica]|nr:cyclin-domain-containing protein [Amylocystis lapponica]